MSSNLRHLRKKKGLNQIEAARALHLTRSTYANYENDQTQPTIDIIERFVLFYGVGAQEMLFENLENAQVIEKSEEKNDSKNAQGNAQLNAQVILPKESSMDISPPNQQLEEIEPGHQAQKGELEAKYTALLEKYTHLLEDKLIEHVFQYKFEDVQATVKAIQELLLRDEPLLENAGSYEEKWAVFRKKKNDALVELGIVSGDSI